MRIATLGTACGALLALLAAPAASAQIVLNEVHFNPPGGDAPNEYLELRGPAGSAVPANTYFLGVEGDAGGSGSGPGTVQSMFSLGGLSFGSNGFLVLLQGSNTYTTAAGATVVAGSGTGWTGVAGFQGENGATDIENTTATFFLVTTSAAPTLGQDLDTNNDGTIELPAGWTILDSVGISDNSAGTDPDRVYGAINFIDSRGTGSAPAGSVTVPVTFTFNGNPTATAYVGRAGNTTGSAASAWVASNLTGTAPNFMTGAGTETVPGAFANQPLNHIGSANFPGVVSNEPTPGANGLALAVASPAAGTAAVRFALPAAGAARIAVYDALGREVAVLLDGVRGAGPDAVTLETGTLAAGVYVVRLEAAGAAVARTFAVAR